MQGNRNISLSRQSKDEYAKLAKRASGARYWLPLAALLVVALLLIPIVWALIAQWAGVSVTTGTSVSDLLATIGGVMGAIFTVGGLVIALVSVLTQFSIEARVRQGFENLMPELDERAQKQIEAHIAFTRAVDEGDWHRAEELASEALEKWPSLQGVRSLMGERISNLTMEWFVSHELEGQRLATTPFNRGEGPTAFGVNSIAGLNLTLTPSPLLFVSREQAPFYQALEWLKEAIKQDGDEDSSLHARVALVHGIAGHFEEMKKALQETLKLNSGLRDYFLQPWNLAMLVYACRNAATLDSGLKAIGSLLDYRLPAAPSDLLKTLQEADMATYPTGWNVYWVAVERPDGDWSVTGRIPSLVTLHIQLSGSEAERTGKARWKQVGGRESGSLPTDEGQAVAIDKLVEQLSGKFVLICQFEPGLATWRIYH